MINISRKTPRFYIILLVVAIFIFTALLGSTTVFGQKVPYNAYLPLVLNNNDIDNDIDNDGCVNDIPFQEAISLEIEKETLAALNRERAAAGGLSPLVMNESLVQIARYHSMDMALNGFFGHDGSAGEEFYERYDWLCEFFGPAKSEIIAWSSYDEVDNVIDWWMNSDPHRKQIMRSDLTLAGVGYVYKADSQNKHYWTVNFGTKATTWESTASSLSAADCTVETVTFEGGGIMITSCE